MCGENRGREVAGGFRMEVEGREGGRVISEGKLKGRGGKGRILKFKGSRGHGCGKMIRRSN